MSQSRMVVYVVLSILSGGQRRDLQEDAQQIQKCRAVAPQHPLLGVGGAGPRVHLHTAQLRVLREPVQYRYLLHDAGCA